MGEQVDLKNRRDGMSEIREFLKRFNLGFNSYSKMIGVSPNTLRKYEKDPDSLSGESRRKIDIGLMVLEREDHIRPKLKDMGDDLSVYKGVSDLHYRNLVKYERDFKEIFRVEMDKEVG